MFLLPGIVAGALLGLYWLSMKLRVLLLLESLVIQWVLILVTFPGGARAETMGFVDRCRGEFPVEEVRACARDIRLKWRDGTLAIREGHAKCEAEFGPNSIAISDAELPKSLQGKFMCIFMREDEETVDPVIYFPANPTARS